MGDDRLLLTKALTTKKVFSRSEMATLCPAYAEMLGGRHSHLGSERLFPVASPKQSLLERACHPLLCSYSPYSETREWAGRALLLPDSSAEQRFMREGQRQTFHHDSAFFFPVLYQINMPQSVKKWTRMFPLNAEIVRVDGKQDPTLYYL